MNTSGLTTDFANVVEGRGVPITINNYSYRTYSGTDYDQEYTVLASGTEINTKGIVLPINSNTRSDDYAYVQQGKIGTYDLKMYIAGSISVGADSRIQVNNGSIYSVAENGIVSMPPDIQNPVYKKVYISTSVGSKGYV